MDRTFLAEYEAPEFAWATYKNVVAPTYKEAYAKAKDAGDPDWILVGVMERVDSKPADGTPGPKGLSDMFAF